LHFAVGILAYFWGVSAAMTFFLHVLFEYVENTQAGMEFINTYLLLWPGGKPYADSWQNSLSDTGMSMIGWSVSFLADKYSSERHLYP
jgi:hypothetical protein